MVTVGAWASMLFFLWFGLAQFVPALNSAMFREIGGVLALIVAVVTCFALPGI